MRNGSNIVVRRFAVGAEDERMSKRVGGGPLGDEGWIGDAGGVFNRLERSASIFDMSVARILTLVFT